LKLKHSSTHSVVFPGLDAHRAPPCSRDVARARTVGLPSVGYLHCVLSRQNEFLPVNKRVDFTTVNQAADCSCSAPVFALLPRLPFEYDYMACMYVFRQSVLEIIHFSIYHKNQIKEHTNSLGINISIDTSICESLFVSTEN